MKATASGDRMRHIISVSPSPAPRFSGPATGRPGLTIVEVLVVFAILAVMISLSLPAILAARQSARQVTCASNLRQLAMAMMLEEQSFRRLPAAGNFSATSSDGYHSWVTSLLDELDEGNRAGNYRFDLPWDHPANLGVTGSDLAVLICPDDISAEFEAGNLSYVVNCGLGWTVPVDCGASLHVDETASTVTIAPLDLNGNGVVCPLDPSADGPTTDLQLLRSTSLFFVENWPPGSGTTRSHRLDDVFDGQSQTLMLSENIRAGHDPATGSTWGSPSPLTAGFFCSSYVCENRTCAAGQVFPERSNDHNSEPWRREAINAAIDQPEGRAPWLSSMHPNGIVNAAFADGHVATISELIDGRVFLALVTPQGSRIGGPLRDITVSAGAW